MLPIHLSTDKPGGENSDLTTLADRIRTETAAAVAAFGKVLEHARTAGVLLLRAKKLVSHGGWLGWLAANNISERTAQRCMQIASRWSELVEANPTRVTDLPLRDALKLLAAPKPKPEPVIVAPARQTEPPGSGGTHVPPEPGPAPIAPPGTLAAARAPFNDLLRLSRDTHAAVQELMAGPFAWLLQRVCYPNPRGVGIPVFYLDFAKHRGTNATRQTQEWFVRSQKWFGEALRQCRPAGPCHACQATGGKPGAVCRICRGCKFIPANRRLLWLDDACEVQSLFELAIDFKDTPEPEGAPIPAALAA